jgi:hypothetical protein
MSRGNNDFGVVRLLRVRTCWIHVVIVVKLEGRDFNASCGLQRRCGSNLLSHRIPVAHGFVRKGPPSVGRAGRRSASHSLRGRANWQSAGKWAQKRWRTQLPATFKVRSRVWRRAGEGAGPPSWSFGPSALHVAKATCEPIIASGDDPADLLGEVVPPSEEVLGRPSTRPSLQHHRQHSLRRRDTDVSWQHDVGRRARREACLTAGSQAQAPTADVPQTCESRA